MLCNARSAGARDESLSQLLGALEYHRLHSRETYQGTALTPDRNAQTLVETESSTIPWGGSVGCWYFDIQVLFLTTEHSTDSLVAFVVFWN